MAKNFGATRLYALPLAACNCATPLIVAPPTFWYVAVSAPVSTCCTASCKRVIPNHFSKSLQVTPSELDETWFVSTTCGFMKPDKILLLYVVWLPGYSASSIQLFPDFCWYSNYSNPHNFLILDCFVISIAPS